MATPVHPAPIVNDLIIEPRAAQALIRSESCLIVDLSRTQTWQRAHIDRAVHVEPSELVDGNKPAVGKLPPLARLEALFSRIGYDPDQHVIAYDDEGGGWAGRFLWTLAMLGHRKMSMIDGGIIAWAEEGLPLTAEVVDPAPRTVSLTLHPEYRATRQEVLDSLGDDGTVVWDARSHEEYIGTKVVSARGGHIPGAINLDWLDVMDRDNNLKVRRDIETILTERGITPDKRVITHCQTHHRSGLTWAVGRSLGYDIRAYDGSWSEWGNDPGTPVETG